MGFSLKAPKIKIKAPKIKLEPSKLISKATEGYTNAIKDIAIKPATELASSAVAGVGQVTSQQGAGAVLGAAGMAFGVPGLGSLIPPTTASTQEFSQRKADFAPPSQVNQSFQQPKDNTTMFIIIGAVIAVLGIGAILIKRK